MISLASLEYPQLSHFQKLALLSVIRPHNLPGDVRVPFPIRLPFQMIEKNNDNSVVQPSGDEDGYISRPGKKSEPMKEEKDRVSRKCSI
jgi:hypothetical protein